MTIPIRLNWSYGGSPPGANIWHARTDLLPANAFEDQVGWLHTYYEAIKEALWSGVTASFEGAISGVGDDADTFWTGTPWTVTGTGGGDPLSPQMCILQRWQAATGGRSGKGRTYLGPLSEGLNDSTGRVSSSAADLIAGAADDLIESSDSAGNGALGIYSRTDAVFRDFVSQSVDRNFAIQRGRLR